MRPLLALLIALGLGSPAFAQIITPAPGLSPTGDASQTTVTASGGSAARTLAVRAADVANVMDYGAYGDTQRALIYGVSCTSGSPTISLAVSSVSSSYVGANIVVGGCGTSGAPLQTTIKTVNGGGSLTLNKNAATTISSATEWVAYGHDDYPAINSAINSGAKKVILPSPKNGTSYGQYSQINLPSSNSIIFDCQGASIAALAPINSQLYQATSGSFYSNQGSSVQNCYLDGLGQASYNIEHGGFGWNYINNTIANATVTNLYVICSSSANTNFSEINIPNDSTVVPTYPTHLIDAECTDNHFTNIIGFGANGHGVYDNTSGSFYTNVHVYQVSGGDDFYFNGSTTHAVDVYADGVAAGYAGFYINGGFNYIEAWRATYSSSWTNQYGVELSTAAQYNVVTGGVAQGFNSDYIVSQDSAGSGTGGSNTVISNGGASYVSMNGSVGGFCGGLQTRCNAQFAIAMGPYSQAGYDGIAIGHSVGANCSESMTIGFGGNCGYSRGVLTWSATPSIPYERQWAVLAASLTGTSATRLTTDGQTATSLNSFQVDFPGSLSMSCTMAVHSTSSADGQMFYMDGTNGSVPAFYVAAATGSPVLVQGSWTAGTPTSGASGKLTPSVGVDSTNNTPSVSLTATSGTWHAAAKCDLQHAD